jgi:dephospho-CoA kinase
MEGPASIVGSAFTVVLLTGLPGSGKTTASGFLQSLGFEVIGLGAIARKYIQQRFSPQGITEWLTAEQELADKNGPAWLWQVCPEQTVVPLRVGSKVCIDSVKSLHEVEIIEEMRCDITLINVSAPERYRHSRLLRRVREDTPASGAEIAQYEHWLLKHGLESCMASASIVFYNEGSIEKFEQSVRAACVRA